MATAAAVAAGIAVYHGALVYYFSQDDFLGLARASGLAPRLAQPWRYVANQEIWDLMRPAGTASAWPHHLVSLLAHTGCVALLYGVLARHLAPWAALVGATFFAVHPALFSTLYWFSTVGDPLALLFGLLALRLSERTDGPRWLAIPFFALSLVTKETLLLLPVAVAACRRWGATVETHTRDVGRATATRAKRLIDSLEIGLAAVALVYVVYFMASAYGAYFLSASGNTAALGDASRAPYALAWEHNLWRNALT